MMMMMMESTMAVRFPAGANFCSSTALSHYRSGCKSDEVTSVHVISHRLGHSGYSNIPWIRSGRLNCKSVTRRCLGKDRIRALAEHLGSASDPVKRNGRPKYHPSEDIAKSTSGDEGARLTAAETTRTVIEVNSKATLMFTGLVDDGVHENLIWPDLPYVTDEHGNIYFQVKNDEDILQSLTSENNFVQVIIGFDTTEMVKEMELSGLGEIDFGIEEIEDGDSDFEDDEDEDDDEEDDDENWVNVLDDDEDDGDDAIGDWAKLETMRFSHPMYFAKKLAEVAADVPIDWMEQPPAGLAIQGVLRPALIEEHSDIRKHISGNQSNDSDQDQNIVENKLDNQILINGNRHESESTEDNSIWAKDSKKDDIPRNGTSFYKLEMVKIQLFSAHGNQFFFGMLEVLPLCLSHGYFISEINDFVVIFRKDLERYTKSHEPLFTPTGSVVVILLIKRVLVPPLQTLVEVEDFRKAHPDAIAHTAAKIIDRLKAGGEKTTQALKSLCWRSKGIQVEEAAIMGVDSLGFDLRVCAGTQIQTLRFAFRTRATSEYSAERQLNDLLFPRIHPKPQRKRETYQNEL